MVKLRQNRDYRYDHQGVMVEGVKPVHEVCSHLKPTLLIAWNETLFPMGQPEEVCVLVNQQVMEKISGMQSSEGLVAEIPMPQPVSLKGKRRILALDGISDPGNVGNLLRTALALGWEGAFLLDGGCDPFNDKAMRAARGATFRLPLAWGNWDVLRSLIEGGSLVPLAADFGGEEPKQMGKQGVVLVLGNEATGISDAARKLCQPVTIPMPGEMESLNVAVAGGILMFALGQT
jgi:TrmH family RNA methyltransferase